MKPRHAIAVAAFGYLLSANALSQTQPTCPKGFQPYANRCISQRMADYISCVEASGGNSDRITSEVANANAGKTDVGVKGSGSGVVVKGSGSVTVDHATEQALATKFEHTWNQKGMEECRKVLDPPKPPSLAIHASLPTEPVTWNAYIGSFGSTPNSNGQDVSWEVISLEPSRTLKTPVKLEFNFEHEIIGTPELCTLGDDGKQRPIVSKTLDHLGTKWITRISDPPSFYYLFLKIGTKEPTGVAVSCLECPSREENPVPKH
jgi:hypothetical protein